VKNITVLALGGNAISADSHKEEGRNILKTLHGVEILIRAGPLVITHGNGPQVGRLFEKLGLPLWLCTAQTQGEIGTLIQQNLTRYLERQNIRQEIITILTHVLIDPADESLAKPTKPIGGFYTEKEAEKLRKRERYRMSKDPAGRGWRQVVPSPKPLGIIEMTTIIERLKHDFIVIAGGGGGIPVFQSTDGVVPIEAVIDKDYTSSLIAAKTGAERLILLTNEDFVKLNFREHNEQNLTRLSLEKAKKLLKEGQFKTGMRTKVDAAVDFLECGGGEALIGPVFRLKEVLEGAVGTVVTA